MSRPLSTVVGFDDAPFERGGSGPVPVVGAVYAGPRLDGVLTGAVSRDGDDAADALADLLLGSAFGEAVQGVLLQGITAAGFNVVDLARLGDRVGRPVLVVARRAPDLGAIRSALAHVPGGEAKWRRIERAGPMEPCAGVWVQRHGLSLAAATATVRLHARNGAIPEPLRTAHLIAGALATGESRGRP